MSDLRDQIRTAFFNQKSKTEVVEVAGVQIEVRQPTIGDIINSDSTEDRRKLAAKMLIDYCFVPGTDTKVFEDTDVDVILATPFGTSWNILQNAISRLSDLELAKETQAKNSD